MKKIIIRGAREHNLKNIDIQLPKDRLVVITGVSGSGKSSLAFDTLYAEGKRRYVESLSTYARQFLGEVEKPDVDSIEGLSPAISIEERSVGRNPRSTVGTITEIFDYLRLLFAKIGIPHCPRCGREIQKQSIDAMIEQIMRLPEGSKVQILSPIVRGRKGEYQEVFDYLQGEGFVRVRIDGELRDLDEEIKLKKTKTHEIDAVVDRLILNPRIRSRLADSLETALKLSDGRVIVSIGGGDELLFSEKFACPDCGVNLDEVTPRVFSFNSPYGACRACGGLGEKLEIDPALVIPDPNQSILQGALAPYGVPKGTIRRRLERLSLLYGFNLDTPFFKLPVSVKEEILYGEKDFQGVIPELSLRYKRTNSQAVKDSISQYMVQRPCSECKGKRLRPESLCVTISNKSIADVCELSIEECRRFLSSLNLNQDNIEVAGPILEEVLTRLQFLEDVGLSYLTLSRRASTLSGGEAQRIRLATQIGSGLTGVVYVLDEPTIGLHPRDNQRLLDTLFRMRDLGNTLLVVEHDEATIRSADYIVDLGPGAGDEGGRVVAKGSLQEVLNNPASLTGRYLKGELKISVPQRKTLVDEKVLELVGVKRHNLKNLNIRIPLGLFTCITGVSGSGKSTLLEEVLYPILLFALEGGKVRPKGYESLTGIEHVDRVVDIDQKPIGKTPRSNPATYTGIFSHIRSLFSLLPESRASGYTPARFSFNVKGGRCEACMGEGEKRVEMYFLPDVYVQCEVCKGKRYNQETLRIKYRGCSISDVLDMTVDEASDFFKRIPPIRRRLEVLQEVGLGYIKLGQPATTLSGGEAQRVKLSRELGKRGKGHTIYLLDEPTTGLHLDDIKKLLHTLVRLRDLGNTIVVIEHHLDVVKCADYVIDLGPEGGDAGGRIVAEGTPDEIMQCKDSYTGRYLKEHLSRVA